MRLQNDSQEFCRNHSIFTITTTIRFATLSIYFPRLASLHEETDYYHNRIMKGAGKLNTLRLNHNYQNHMCHSKALSCCSCLS